MFRILGSLLFFFKLIITMDILQFREELIKAMVNRGSETGKPSCTQESAEAIVGAITDEEIAESIRIGDTVDEVAEFLLW